MSLHRSEQNSHKGHGNICHCESPKPAQPPAPNSTLAALCHEHKHLQETPNTTKPQTKEQKKPLTFCKDINRRSIRQEPRPALELPGRALDKHGHHAVPATQRDGHGMGTAWDMSLTLSSTGCALAQLLLLESRRAHLATTPPAQLLFVL